MLEFPSDFFLPEEREGFLVDATMKTVWAAELEVLNEVAIVCARHGLQWYAAYGTLLGAARHNGFIPWDDDIDIWLLREDYRELMEALPQELPNGFVIRSPHAREGYPEYQVYIDNCNKISVEPEHLEKFHGCPFMVGIDIFPLDTLPDDPEKLQMQRALFSTSLLLQRLDYDRQHDARRLNDNGVKSSEPDAEAEKQALESAYALLDTLKKQYHIAISPQLLRRGHRAEGLKRIWQAAENLGRGGSKLAMYLDYLNYGKVYEKAWFENPEGLDYEIFQIPAPSSWEKILQIIFGANWSTPIRYPAMHNYPCYKGQLEALRKMVEEAEEKQRV